jgi:hypothetical protein
MQGPVPTWRSETEDMGVTESDKSHNVNIPHVLDKTATVAGRNKHSKPEGKKTQHAVNVSKAREACKNED